MALPIANTAKYELTLPSQQKVVSYRPFLVKEEKILMMAMETGDGAQILNAVKDIVKSCTFGEIIPDDYPMFDIEYLFLNIRAKSVGEVSKLKILCPDDKKTYVPVEVDLTKIDVLVDDNHDNKIVLDEKRMLGVTMKYPTLAQVNPGMFTGDIKIDDMYDMLTAAVDSIFEGETVHLAKDSTKEEIREFIDSLTSDQMKKINNFYVSMPRLEHEIEVTNPKTQVTSKVTLKGLADFFA